MTCVLARLAITGYHRTEGLSISALDGAGVDVDRGADEEGRAYRISTRRE
jgi:hypothetical protein